MLTITIVMSESFNDATQEFSNTSDYTLTLEHSLISLSKWESFWEKPFLSSTEKTSEETMRYIKAMVLTPEIPPEVFEHFSNENINAVNDYINAKMTATWFRESEKKASSPARETVTAELIYYWMIALNIPFECQNWHFNRLLTLVQVCNEKNTPAKKMTPREAAQQRRDLNVSRRQKLGTKG